MLNFNYSFELNEDMQTACEIYAQWLEDSTQVNTKTLVSSDTVHMLMIHTNTNQNAIEPPNVTLCHLINT